MAFDRIKVLVERLRQRFDPAEAEELQRELHAADQEIAALQDVQRRQTQDDAHESAERARRLDDFGSGGELNSP